MNVLTTPQKSIYVDTQALVYAYREANPEWSRFLGGYLDSGYRLVLTEEHLLEFAQWHDAEGNGLLVRRLLALQPIWLRSFADIQTDEINIFLAGRMLGQAAPPALEVFSSTYEGIATRGEKNELDAVQFVSMFSSPRARALVRELRAEHIPVLDTLTKETAATADRRLSPETRRRAHITAVQARLARGSTNFEPMAGELFDASVRFCMEHWKRLLKACPSFSAEEYLSDFRASGPARKARLSDSVDLTASVAALPYVDVFVTNDGFLHGGLDYVKKRMPKLAAQLLRSPPSP